MIQGPVISGHVPAEPVVKTRFLHIWEKLTFGYWFVPALMALGAVLLAFGMLALDQHVLARGRGPGWLYGGGAGGARSLLSTVASSIVTVAGVVFSITIVTLTQASSQFGPRLLRSFMRDTSNQVVLGTFVATFVYCLLVLRSIYGDDENGHVPQASVSVAVLLALASLAVLIYYIHHVAFSLQAPQVVAAVAAELETVIDRQFLRDTGAEADEASGERQVPDEFRRNAWTVPAEQDGYLQAIDQEALMDTACREQLILVLDCRPGDFLMRGSPVLHAWPPERCRPKLATELSGLFMIGNHRTPEQDVEFGIHQLVEIACRALSPGINDPFTAITCLDWLGVALCRITRGRLPSRFRCDRQGCLRIVAPLSTFRGLADAAFNQIRQNGVGKMAVALRQLEVVAQVAEHIRGHEAATVLMDHTRMIYEANLAVVQEPSDRADLDERYQRVHRVIGEQQERP